MSFSFRCSLARFDTIWMLAIYIQMYCPTSNELIKWLKFKDSWLERKRNLVERLQKNWLLNKRGLKDFWSIVVLPTLLDQSLSDPNIKIFKFTFSNLRNNLKSDFQSDKPSSTIHWSIHWFSKILTTGLC